MRARTMPDPERLRGCVAEWLMMSPVQFALDTYRSCEAVPVEGARFGPRSVYRRHLGADGLGRVRDAAERYERGRLMLLSRLVRPR